RREIQLRYRDFPRAGEDRWFRGIKDAPRLLSGEAQNRRHGLEHSVADERERSLRRPTRPTGARGRIPAILEDIEVEAAQLFGTIALELLHHWVELELAVRIGEFGKVRVRHRERVAVELEQLAHGQRIDRRVEVGGIGHEEAERVPDAPVALDHAFEDLVRD